MSSTEQRVTRGESRPNLSGEVAAFLRDAILSGRLRPRTKIDQDRVAVEMGVSKLPVREALIALESDGLIENIPRRGAFVAPLERGDVHDHYEIYGILSGMAAARAASALSDSELETLSDLLGQMTLERDPALLQDLNERFHGIINKAGSSRRLSSVLKLLATSIPQHFFETTPTWPARASEDHRRILSALQSRDGEAARAEMTDHLRASGEYAVEALEANGFWETISQPTPAITPSPETSARTIPE